MNWSNEQKAIFDFFREGKGHLIVEAYAGTGKTTTIKEAFSHAPERRILYAVFNKRMQREAQEKITDPRVDVRTLHSLGYLFIRRTWKDAKPDDDVEAERVELELFNVGLAEDKELIGVTIRLLAFAKNTIIEPCTDNLRDLADDRLLLCGDQRRDDAMISACLRAMRASRVRRHDSRISFDDMVWLPVAMNWATPRYELVAVDEAQDMNLPQLIMARKASSGRVIVVGDRRQAIYGFRGAASDGISVMKAELNAAELKLTTTYRCPRAVVEVANQVVPDYKAAPEAPPGSVVTAGTAGDAREGDSILSRLNAPLMPLALTLIRAGKPARIEGRDVGRQLLAMVKTMRAKSVPDFLGRVESWLAKQVARLKPQKKSAKRIEQAEDVAATLSAVAEGCASVEEIECRIDALFQDSNNGDARPMIVLSTVHKAKGLEWPRVFVLTETFRRGRGEEEDNIWYVAVTRAMRELFLVGASASLAQPAALEQAAARPPTTASTDQAFDDYDLPTGMAYHRLGDVKLIGGAEHVCVMVNRSRAMFAPMQKVRRTIKGRFKDGDGITREFWGSAKGVCPSCDPADVIRRMSAAELQPFLDRAAGRPKNETQTSPAKTQQDKTNMSKNINTGLTGSAQFFREQCAAGMTKKATIEAAIKRWPKLEGDDSGLESRWAMAEKAGVRAKAKAKAPAAKTEKPTGKAVKAKKADSSKVVARRLPSPPPPVQKRPAQAPPRPETADPESEAQPE